MTKLCKCCGQPLNVQTQPALIAGRDDLIQIECINDACQIAYVTVYGWQSYEDINPNEWDQSHRNVLERGAQS
jgi:hypothetical protein